MTEDSTTPRQRVYGVFSSQEVRKVGTGTTTRKTISKMFWFCSEAENGEITIQPLNANYIPSGAKRNIPLDRFLTLFSPEPEIYINDVYPKMREVNRSVSRGDRHRKSMEYYSAEMEYGQALKLDEENVRANFGLGITYLERGEAGRANNIFERLVKLDAAFEDEHKHLFNEFGIKLRKNALVDQAITYYKRALELATLDENLLYNMARAYLEKKDVDRSVDYLLEALAINPTLEPAVRFLLWLTSNQMIPEAAKSKVNEALLKVRQLQSEDKDETPKTQSQDPLQDEDPLE